MDRELKAKWVKALRSDKYKQQADGDLKNSNGYCCLGVLGEIAGCSQDVLTTRPYIRTRNHPHRYLILPVDVQEGLAELNDDEVPFEVIAGLINETL